MSVKFVWVRRSAIIKWALIGGLIIWISISSASSQLKEENYSFEIRSFGFTLGYVFAGTISNGRRYKVASVMRSSDFVSIFSKRRFETKAEGTISNGMIKSERYELLSNIGSNQSTKLLTFSDGQITNYEVNSESEPNPVDINDGIASLDYLSGFYALLNPKPANELCNMSFYLKDGERVALMNIEEPSPLQPENIICNSTYTRVKGFDADEMENEPQIDFTLLYTPSSTSQGYYELKRMSFTADFGQISIVRRN